MMNYPQRISFSITVIFILTASLQADVKWICSTDGNPWQMMPTATLEPHAVNVPATVRVQPAKTYQTIDGFGGCFNELGWQALRGFPIDQQKRAVEALFGKDGCAFNMARVPIGSSDFATSAYSLDDTPGDLELKHFSIDRDQKLLIPYIKAAMEIQPDLECWGSPWSPPAWMKTNNNYSQGEIRSEPAVLDSYAKYLTRWVQEYQGQGIHVIAVCPQNEPAVWNNYPTCRWSGETLRSFIANHLGPTIRDRKVNVQIWLGTLNDGDANDRAVTVLEDHTANAFVSAVTFQYGGLEQIADVHAMYPDKQLLQSETECSDGKNSWADAQRLFTLMRLYLDRGAGSYFAWNMVLDETGLSTWNWRQNALVTANQQTHQIQLHGEYYVMRHFSQFVHHGAKRILTTGRWKDKIAFANPDGSIVLVMGNSSPDPQPATLLFAGREKDTVQAVLPAGSVSTFVVEGAN